MQLIGILTLAQNDTTQAFQRFRKGLRKNYVEGTDISLHFRFANDETELASLATQLLRIPVDVMVTGGMQALYAVTTQSHDIKIVHVGDTHPPVSNPLTGYSLNALDVCSKQLDKLVGASSAKATVTVLVPDPKNGNDPKNNNLFVSLKDYQTNNYPDVTLKALTVTTRKQLHDLTSDKIVDNFMLIANGMFYDEAPFIANLVLGAKVNAIFPEREYKKAMGPSPPKTWWVRGHDLPSTFEKAADHVHNFLDAEPMDPPSSAPLDVDPGA